MVGYQNETCCKAVLRGGHIPVVIPLSFDSLQVRQMLQHMDIVFLLGGEDVNPSRYGAEPSPHLGAVNDERDVFEFMLLREAVRQHKPIFGVCRGEQMMNVFFGGTLYQDIPSELSGNHGGVMHKVRIDKSSRLYKILRQEEITTNSSHHQAVKKIAPGFRIVARAEDGVVEAIESKEYPAAAVQWHPESLWQKEELYAHIFEQMMRLVKK